jgi:hypothetical protein
MSLQLNKIQTDVLNILLNKYEKSITYKGENIRNQSFTIKPEKVFPDYNGDYTDQDDVNQFNRDMLSLSKENLIVLEYVEGIPVIKNIKLNINSMSDVYGLLGREDITKKRYREIEMYSRYIGVHSIIDAFCKEQINRLNNYKDAKYTNDVANNILELLKIVLNNKQDIMERELSVEVLADTKLFEKKYRSRVCKIIERYGNLELDLSLLDEREKEKAILEEFHVLSNPSYIFFKGNLEIYYTDGDVVVAKSDKPFAISSEVIERIKKIKVNSDRIVTVENLTSYNRIHGDGTTFIFLSGYHNTAKQRFLRKIAEYNREVKWYHFGDVDPDGFYILKNLISKTNISFEPLYMGVQQLVSCKQYCKPLEKNDIIKAKSLKNDGFYDEVMSYMLANDCKLEQEIISWLKEWQ